MSEPLAPGQPDERPAGARIVDPRAVRVFARGASAQDGIEVVVVEPPEVPLAPAPRVVGAGILGSVGAEMLAIAGVSDEGAVAFVDGLPLQVRLDHLDGVHGVLTEITEGGPMRTRLLLMPLERQTGSLAGVVRREIVVDGWRIEVEIESERRASLRERARRGRDEAAHGGPTHVRAIIPGRIVSVSVVPGDPVEAGQQLLVVEAMKMQNELRAPRDGVVSSVAEAMKMQNELRAPRDGVVSSVAVGVGGTIEVGDLLLVLE